VAVVTVAAWPELSLLLAQALHARREPPAGRDADAALIEALRGGDGKAFAALYHRHVDWVWGRVTTLLGPVPEREDLVQQIFLEVHRALPGFRGDAAFSTFLFRIVANVAYRYLARRRRRPPELGADALDELVAPSLSPELALRERQELERIFALLSRIKPKKRIALLLRAVEGLSLDEIASIVGARMHAVAQRVRHAQLELAAMLAREEGRS
jgi:RNA polymerase sigma-70 factor (ECF subfamily)